MSMLSMTWTRARKFLLSIHSFIHSFIHSNRIFLIIIIPKTEREIRRYLFWDTISISRSLNLDLDLDLDLHIIDNLNIADSITFSILLPSISQAREAI